MALSSKKQNQLTKEYKDLQLEVSRLSKVEENLEKSKSANKELMKDNDSLRKEVADLKKQITNLQKSLFAHKESLSQNKASTTSVKFTTDKERILYLLNEEMKSKKILMLSGKEAVNHTITKYFPTIDKIITAGQRNFKPEVIRSLDLLIIITDYVGHSETGKAEDLAVKNNVPIIKLKKISLTTLTEKLQALYNIK